ncbi:MAG: hypothetical protein ABIS03_09355 [Gemmatimonadaceae bacterium]
MKRLVMALGLVAAATLAAPLSAQSRSSGPWWDPANTGNRGTVDNRGGTVYNDGRIYDSRNADGQWRRASRDRNGNTIYVRTRRDSRGNVIQERARRDSRGRYVVLDRRVIRSSNGRNDNDRNDNDRIYDRRDRRNDNDRWDQNDGHDNGKHNGQYKNKNKNQNKNKGRNH